MNELAKAVLIQVSIYIGIIIATLVVMHRYTNGFLWAYIKVKFSRGKKIGIKSFGVSRTTFKAIPLDEGIAKFTTKGVDGKPEKHLVSLNKGCIYHFLGIQCADYDEVSQQFVSKPDNTPMAGMDTAKADSITTRALERPSLDQNQGKLIVIILVIVILGTLVAGIAAFFAYKASTTAQLAVDMLAKLLPPTPPG